MKKYFFSVACLCLCVGFSFTSCSKDDDGPGTSSVKDNKITATVSASNVDNVKALADYSENKIDGKWVWTGTEIANNSFSNGFTLTLPATVDPKCLYTFDDAPKGVSISDKNTQLSDAVIVGYNEAGVQAGTFFYGSTTCETELTYADRNVTITGSYSDETGNKWVYNMSLVKGWNIIYIIEIEKNDVYTNTITTSDPGGLKWYFDADSDSKSFQTESITKFAGSKKLMFKGLK